MSNSRRDELWDRLTDAALREALGGKRPGGHKAQVGSVMPGSRAAKGRGAGAGKHKPPTSAERAGWMRPGDQPRGSALKALVVATCVVVGLTLVMVINHAAGDRPWFWPVAKQEVAVHDSLSVRTRSESDVGVLSIEGYHDSNVNGQLPDGSGAGQLRGQAGPWNNRASGRGEGFTHGHNKGLPENAWVYDPKPHSVGDLVIPLPSPSYTPSGAPFGNNIGGSGTALRAPGTTLNPVGATATKLKMREAGEAAARMELRVVTDGTENTVRTGERSDKLDRSRKVLAEASAVASKDPARVSRLKQVMEGKDFDSLVDLVTTTIKPESWNEAGKPIDVDGEDVALALRTIAGTEVAPEVVKEIADRIRDGRGAGPGQGGDRYQPIYENRFLAVGHNPLSTFSIDVDTASYSKVRRIIFQHGELPPPDAVRLEEFVNYHVYRYAGPEAAPVGADSRRRSSATDAGSAPGSSATGVASYKGEAAYKGQAAKKHPFAVHGDVAACPWQPGHKLLRIAIKGREIKNEDRPPSNLVFLVDVSGSMDEHDKLPLVKKGLKTLVQRLRATDRVAIVVYAGDAGLVLPSTPGNEKAKILGVLDSLKPEGSTNGAQGIHLAYDIAAQNFLKEGTNRVILATDGDFNVGTTSDAELVRLVEERAKGKVFLTTLGFGIGNHNDSMLEQIADKGNGQCAYIDTELETYKVFVEQLSGTLVTIAKDVKIQVEFNPAKVAAYRLLGYENRMLRTEDFKDDTKDAGEIGAGHTVTALYEIVPVPSATGPLEAPPVEEAEATELKYQKPAELTPAAHSGELLTVHLRYKQPEADKSQPLDVPVKDAEVAFGKAPGDFQFAAAVASFGMILRNSQYRGSASYDNVLELAKAGLKDDDHGYRAEFVDLVKRAKEISEKKK
jgi:Ca-activated chloride channel family protein